MKHKLFLCLLYCAMLLTGVDFVGGIVATLKLFDKASVELSLSVNNDAMYFDLVMGRARSAGIVG